MSGSILSWDELETSENSEMPVSIPSIEEQRAKEQNQRRAAELREQRAKESLANLDTTEAIKEIEATGNSIMERAKANLVNVPDIVGTGNRLTTAEKHLLNCTSDLNQLIPFKYDFAWNAYLNSCNAHWMPMEVDIINDIKVYATLSTEQRLPIIGALASYLSTKKLSPHDVGVNMYRHITNPESRQYILRFLFEDCVMSHAYRHLNESFNIIHEEGKNPEGLQVLGKTYESMLQIRAGVISKLTQYLTDPNMTTQNSENTSKFMAYLGSYFAVLKSVIQLSECFMLYVACQRNGLKGLEVIVNKMLTDTTRQIYFSNQFLGAAAAENEPILDTHALDIMSMVMDAIARTVAIVRLVTDIDNFEQVAYPQINNALIGLGRSFNGEVIGGIDQLLVNFGQMSQAAYSNAQGIIDGGLKTNSRGNGLDW